MSGPPASNNISYHTQRIAARFHSRLSLFELFKSLSRLVEKEDKSSGFGHRTSKIRSKRFIQILLLLIEKLASELKNMISAVDMADSHFIQLSLKLVHVVGGVSGNCKDFGLRSLHLVDMQINKIHGQLLCSGSTIMQEHTKSQTVELEILVNEMASDASVVLVGLRSPVIKGKADRQTLHGFNSSTSDSTIQVDDDAPDLLAGDRLVLLIIGFHQLMKGFFLHKVHR
jgi:hypothetical protein